MSSVDGIGGGCSPSMMQSMQGARQRPDTTKMAEELFSRLDTTGQGYLTQADLQSALDTSASGSAAATTGTTSSGSTSASSLFQALDGDGDGKVTQQEFGDAVKKLSEQLHDHAMSSRMQGGGMPPPPPPEGDAGFTKDELTSQLASSNASSSSDSARQSLLSSVVQNFDAADTNGDGKVSFQEAMVYQQASAGSTSAANGDTATASAAASASESGTGAGGTLSDARFMHQIMQLMHAYGVGANSATAASAVSATA